MFDNMPHGFAGDLVVSVVFFVFRGFLGGALTKISLDDVQALVVAMVLPCSSNSERVR